MTPFTREDIDNCWPKYQVDYFLDVLNGDYDLEEARSDLRGLIGSKFDLRNTPVKEADHENRPS